MYQESINAATSVEVAQPENGHPTSTRLPPKAPLLSQDIAFLNRYGIGYPALRAAERRAERFGIAPSAALIANGAMSEPDYYRCVAFELGLEFSDEAVTTNEEPFFQTPSPSSLHKMAWMVRAQPVDQSRQSSTFHIAPDREGISQLRERLQKQRSIGERLRVTTLSTNRQCLLERCSPSLLRTAIDGLRERFPAFSARWVISVPQALFLFCGLQILTVLTFLSSTAVMIACHLFASAFYIGSIFIRVIAAADFDETERRLPLHGPPQDRSVDHLLPTYSVLVALYRESGQVDDLVDALLGLDWPKERLDIKLVCEADDTETVEAVRRRLTSGKGCPVELVCVPKAHPRTKPKALNYALPLATGDYVVIYDAEDRPDPLQLREAYAAFKAGPDELACVQAPLVVYNHNESWLSRLFAIEYSALFDGMLPMLARARAPLPLGGTSNHFRRDVLEKVGGWDPYNVTEDADLGIRIARSGYQIGVIRRPTHEEAPISFMVWLKQRTRWFKGWYQTWLVHMRHPIALARDLGFKGTVVFHLMITGMVVSSLVHPLLLYFIGVGVFRAVDEGVWQAVAAPLFLLDLFTILLGYFSFGWLAWRTLPVRGMEHLRTALWTIPVYWMLLSLAAWRALWHLIRRPHEWEKTPHRLRRSEKTSVLA